jgi:hypothetical protein
LVAVLALAGSGSFSSLAAQVPAPDYSNEGWFYRVAPWVWFSNIDGHAKLGENSLAVGDTLLETAFYADAEIGKGRWRGIATFSTTSLSNTGELGGPVASERTEVDYKFSWTTAELFAAWQVDPFVETHAFLLYAGARYIRHKLEIMDERDSPPINEAWVDPVAGARYWAPMGSIFWASVDGNMGGFGLGSEFAWRIRADLGAHIAGPVDVAMGYNYFQTEYKGKGYAWDEGVSQGWYFGLLIKG